MKLPAISSAGHVKLHSQLNSCITNYLDHLDMVEISPCHVCTEGEFCVCCNTLHTREQMVFQDVCRCCFCRIFRNSHLPVKLSRKLDLLSQGKLCIYSFTKFQKYTFFVWEHEAPTAKPWVYLAVTFALSLSTVMASIICICFFHEDDGVYIYDLSFE